MDWLHGILNLIGLLFWVLWRAGTMPRPKPANAVAGPTPRQGKTFKHSWVYLIALIILLTARSVFYHRFGPGLDWIPSLESIDVAPHFRSDFFQRALAYSTISFARWLSALYFCLALLVSVKPDTDTAKIWRSFLRSQFGWLGGLSPALLWASTLVLSILVHTTESTWIAHIGAGGTQSSLYKHLLLLIMLDCRATVYLSMIILTLFILNSYVYFGEHPFWKNIDNCGTRLFAPFRKTPLIAGKVDPAPFIAMTIALAISFVLRHEQLAALLR
jgi:uncharacterized protein YggT (Ycf19 family)